MADTTTPLREKLTLLMHGQFPTGIDKVGLPIYMYRQNRIFRNLGAGPFDHLVSAVSLDPAMLIWLDLSSNQRLSPNENFARELMERLTMGVGNYSQRDVREAARAFTGWGIAYPSGGFEFDTWAHDFGEKTFLGHRGNLDGEDIVRIVTHSDAAARCLPARMWSFLAYPVSMGHFACVPPPCQGFREAVWQRLPPVGTHRFRTGALQSSNRGWMGEQSVLVVECLLSSASSLAQFNFAQSVFQVADLSPVEEAAGPARVEAIGALLGVDSWGALECAPRAHERRPHQARSTRAHRTREHLELRW